MSFPPFWAEKNTHSPKDEGPKVSDSKKYEPSEPSSALRVAFSHVLKKFQELPEMDFSRLSSSQDKQMYIHKMQDILQEKAPPQYHARLMEEIFGLGPLSSLIKDPSVSEIIVNGKEHIFYEQKGRLCSWSGLFLSDLTFYNFVQGVLEETGMVLSLKQPFVDGEWRGWRVHIAQKPLVNQKFHLSFRRHPKNPWTLNRLQKQGWAPKQAIDIIETLLRERSNILIVGPTSSGKTSVLNACLQALPVTERIVSIEDSSELLLPNSFSTKLLTRTGSEGTLSSIDQSELVRQSLRMRPDRIVVGEARGAEAKDLLMALATGHSGSLGTLHAKEHKQALWRLEMLVQMGAPSWNTHTIRQMIVLSIDHLMVLGRHMGERTLMSIYKLAGVEQTGFLFEPLWTHLSQSDDSFPPVSNFVG